MKNFYENILGQAAGAHPVNAIRIRPVLDFKINKAMTEQEAIKRLIEIDPAFKTRHEILRYIAGIAFMRGYNEGYESGFQVGCATGRGIEAMQAKFDQVDAMGETLVQTYEILKPKP